MEKIRTSVTLGLTHSGALVRTLALISIASLLMGSNLSAALTLYGFLAVSSYALNIQGSFRPMLMMLPAFIINAGSINLALGSLVSAGILLLISLVANEPFWQRLFARIPGKLTKLSVTLMVTWYLIRSLSLADEYIGILLGLCVLAAIINKTSFKIFIVLAGVAASLIFFNNGHLIAQQAAALTQSSHGWGAMFTPATDAFWSGLSWLGRGELNLSFLLIPLSTILCLPEILVGIRGSNNQARSWRTLAIGILASGLLGLPAPGPCAEDYQNARATDLDEDENSNTRSMVLVAGLLIAGIVGLATSLVSFLMTSFTISIIALALIYLLEQVAEQLSLSLDEWQGQDWHWSCKGELYQKLLLLIVATILAYLPYIWVGSIILPIPIVALAIEFALIKFWPNNSTQLRLKA